MSRLGLIAGGGSLPLKLIETCKRTGRDIFVLAIEGQAEKPFSPGVPHHWIKLGETGKTISLLKSEAIDTLVLAGSVRRPSLSELRPDWRTVRVFAKLGLAALGDDALLRAVANEIRKEGIALIGAHEIEPDLLTPEGFLTSRKPSPENIADMEYGIKIVRELGRLDVGQAAVVQEGIALGVEAVEGTDALLKRARDQRRKGSGGVLVKGCKPQQDKRLDLPAIGLRTLRLAHEAGLSGIAVEAGASLLLDREEVLSAADKLGLFIVGFKA